MACNPMCWWLVSMLDKNKFLCSYMFAHLSILLFMIASEMKLIHTCIRFDSNIYDIIKNRWRGENVVNLHHTTQFKKGVICHFVMC